MGNLIFSAPLNEYSLTFSSTSKYIIVKNCLFIREGRSNGNGIQIKSSSNIKIEDSLFDSSKIFIDSSNNVTLKNNTLTATNLVIDSSNNLSIDDKNTINGDPIMYYENLVGLDINFNNSPIAMLIINNCSSSSFSNGIISASNWGVLIERSDFINITFFNINSSVFNLTMVKTNMEETQIII